VSSAISCVCLTVSNTVTVRQRVSLCSGRHCSPVVNTIRLCGQVCRFSSLTFKEADSQTWGGISSTFFGKIFKICSTFCVSACQNMYRLLQTWNMRKEPKVLQGMAPCRLVNSCWGFGGTCCLLEGLKKPAFGLLRPWRHMILRKVRDFTSRHGVISQNTWFVVSFSHQTAVCHSEVPTGRSGNSSVSQWGANWTEWKRCNRKRLVQE